MKKLTFSLLLLPFALLTLASQCKKESAAGSERIVSSAVSITKAPLFLDDNMHELILLRLKIDANADPLTLKKITFSFSEKSALDCIAVMEINYCGPEPGIAAAEPYGKSNTVQSVTSISGSKILGPGTHVFRINMQGKSAADMLSEFKVESVTLDLGTGGTKLLRPETDYTFHVARVLRAAGQDNCHTYRIPGLVTTGKGTLIAVYDNRYNSSADLQGNIDVGMSRSTDGGNTWSKMKVIMDMGEWGGRSQSENGIGDPCVLFDKNTNTIWVAALWFHGNAGKTAWGNSRPGLEPEITGQFILVKSTDDGLTWSEPINITKQIKNPDWYLFFQGPGMGICMSDGTLVFPAQFKDSQQVPHSTIVYSKDQGATWHVGTGAKPNTTEAQVVELQNGNLMLNMRDDLNRNEKGPSNGRAVSVSADMGKTWSTHSTSNSELPEPNCMASIISTQTVLNGRTQQVLLFSNPNDKSERNHMTIKASADQGNSWPLTMQYEYNVLKCYGYSCLTMIDASTVGVLYEGERSLIFQKIPLSSILK